MKLALRTLLVAGFLGGLMVPRASAQYGLICTYDDLARNGDTVFGYSESNVSIPECFNGDPCWGEHSSYVEVSDWHLDVVHGLYDLSYLYYGYPNCMSDLYGFGGADLTINPEISTSGDQYVEDSGVPTAYFDVSSQSGTPTGHGWDFVVAASGSTGNNPSVAKETR